MAMTRLVTARSSPAPPPTCGRKGHGGVARYWTDAPKFARSAPAVARDIRGENGGQLAFDGLRHGSPGQPIISESPPPARGDKAGPGDQALIDRPLEARVEARRVAHARARGP